MKLRVGLILTTMVLVGMLLSGVVLAVTKHCNHNCRGTGGDDYLTGSGSNNTLSGLGGADTVKGLGGTDWLFGDPGGDRLTGGTGFDHIDGGTGVDWLDGKKGGDHLKDVEHTPYSSTARSKQRKVDVLIGDSGNDIIRARDGKKDIIRGGPGYDKAYVDKVDKVQGVEKEVVPGGGGNNPPGNNPPGNTPPVAKNDKLTTTENHSKDIDVIANDTDVDGDTLSISSFTQPSHGEVWQNGDGTSVEYAPVEGNSSKEGYSGKDSFTYKATDGAADSKVATVKVTVNPLNDCEDTIDNDGDGKIDFGPNQNYNDPGCTSANDPDEN